MKVEMIGLMDRVNVERDGLMTRELRHFFNPVSILCCLLASRSVKDEHCERFTSFVVWHGEESIHTW